MKVAIILYAFELHRGGVEQQAFNLANRLSELGNEVVVFANKVKYTHPLKFQVRRLSTNPIMSLIKPLNWFLYYKKVSQLSKIMSFDIIHNFWYGANQDIIRVGGGLHENYLKALYPKTYRLQRFKPENFVLIKLQEDMFRKGKYKKIICNSELCKREIIDKFGFSSDVVSVIYNGIDLDKFNYDRLTNRRIEVREKLHLGRDEVVILFVGSGFKRKGLKYALEIFSNLKTELSDIGRRIVLVVIGKGKINKYKRLTKELGIASDVYFLGLQKNIEDYYAGSDLFLLPSLYDPFPSVVLEAMSCGSIPFVSKFSGAAEIIKDGSNGFVINPYAIDDVVYMMKNVVISKRREEIKANAIQTAKNFSIERNVDEVLKVYEECRK